MGWFIGNVYILFQRFRYRYRFAFDLELLNDFYLFTDLPRLSGVPSGNELTKRTTYGLQILLHLLTHLFHARGMPYMTNKIPHLFRIRL